KDKAGTLRTGVGPRKNDEIRKVRKICRRAGGCARSGRTGQAPGQFLPAKRLRVAILRYGRDRPAAIDGGVAAGHLAGFTRGRFDSRRRDERRAARAAAKRWCSEQ